RGFEKFCEGRPFYEMPGLMARICGICPVSHLVASSKACDAIMAVSIPPVAENLRRLMNLAQILQSHALNAVHLSGPDLALGMDAPAAERNIFGLVEKHPGLAQDGISLRSVGQHIIETLGNKRVHPAWIVPGGVNSPLSAQQRDHILSLLPDALVKAQRLVDWFKSIMDSFSEEIRVFGNFPSLFMGLVDEEQNLEHYHGSLKVIDFQGKTLVPSLPVDRYGDYIAEAVEPWSYLKSPYFKAKGYPNGIYRVGPLARLNIVEGCGTRWADQELAVFKDMDQPVVSSSFHYHYARLIEMLFCIERMQQLLEEPDILDTHVRAYASANARRGIGVSEAPRGTLIHDYEVGPNGLIKSANLIIATGNNNLAMNQAVLQVAKRFVRGPDVTDGMLNRVEAVIRAYDPCLSCSTHALGKMPLEVTIVDSDGHPVRVCTNP
ncbi:MAG TPA: Ni/Fe hydrogenase subunit alpha, partial [Polyangiaceae bacterium]|nr:Ni/Fe hydrogenase subunit alpha [Polyangiaceae bacterium]